jgi:integrase/recombinase XerD
MSVFKRRSRKPDPKTGKSILKSSKSYYGRFRDELGILRTVRLCADRQASEAMLSRHRVEASRLKAGLGNPYRSHHEKPLSEHLDAFHGALKAKGGTVRHARETFHKLSTAFEACGFRRITDLNAGRFSQWLADRRSDGLGHRTSNAYLVAAKSFGNWLVKDRRHSENPFVHLSRVNQRVDVRTVRRALVSEEASRLLHAAEQGKPYRGLSGADRSMLIRTALETGFRVGELASLTEASFDLSEKSPSVTVAAAYSKRRKTDRQPIRTEFAEAVRAWLRKRQPHPGKPQVRGTEASRLWPGTWSEKGATMIRLDLESARVQWVSEATDEATREARNADRDFLRASDSEGRIVDFHSLRHSYISNVSRTGASPKVCQELARHSTVTLTMGYTHTTLNDTLAGLNGLPNFDDWERRLTVSGSNQQSPAEMVAATTPEVTRKVTHFGCHSGDIPAQTFTIPASELVGVESEETPANAGVSQGFNEVSALGLEPRTYGLKVRCSTD